MLKTSILISVFTFFIVLYSLLLGSRGIFERKELETKLILLQDEVDKLEKDSHFLEVKRKTLLEDKDALAKEASKYYILSDEANIIHFKESVRKETSGSLFASSVTELDMKKKYKSENGNQNFFRLVYILLASSILFLLNYKLGQRSDYVPKRNFK